MRRTLDFQEMKLVTPSSQSSTFIQIILHVDLNDKLQDIFFFEDEKNSRLPRDELCGSIKMIFNLHSNHLVCKFELQTLVGARSKMKFGILWNWIQRLMCFIKASWEEIRSSQNYGPNNTKLETLISTVTTGTAELGQKWNFSELDFSFINICAYPRGKFQSHFFSWIGEGSPQKVKP